MIKQLILCDLCKKEDNPNAYWAVRHSGAVLLDFSQVNSRRFAYKYENLCEDCALELMNAVAEALDNINNRIALQGGNDDKK